MKTLVVGDLHGQLELVLRAFKTPYPVIFLGDYVDSFNRSVTDQIETLRLVLDGVRDGRCRALRGNHEMSYIDNRYRCSGYNTATQIHMDHFSRGADPNLDVLEDYIFCEGFLLSHAGVSQELLDYHNITLDEYLASGDFDGAGYARGGTRPVGGLRWCDWRFEFAAIADQPQIVGHTRGREIRQNGNSYCIDVLEDGCTDVVLIEDGEVEVVDLMKL